MIEERTHPLIRLAKQHMLHHYFGDFAAPTGKYFLFIGRKIAILGRENSPEAILQLGDIEKHFREVGEKLTNAGITTPPSLFFQYEPDN